MEVEEEQLETGSLAMALEAVGSSGATYRLRNAIFDVVGLSNPDIFQADSELDPLAIDLTLDVPSGNYDVFLAPGWFMERDNGITVEPVPAIQLTQNQLVTVNPGQETQAFFAFEADDQILLGDGTIRISIDVTETSSPPNGFGTVIETNDVALGFFTLRDTLNAADSNAGRPPDADLAYRTLIDSYASAALGQEPQADHCDDQQAEFGGPGLNGFNHDCDRLERDQLPNLDSWFPTAIVNRFDLAPVDGSNCGQQRLTFANNDPIGNGRMTMIIEAVVPNPDPACGLAGCMPIAQLWEQVSQESDPLTRGIILSDAYLSLGTQNAPPFINANQLGPNGGQIRTNNFNDNPWTLREFHYDGASSIIHPVPVAASPNGELWNDNSSQSIASFCRANFIGAMNGLLTNNVSEMSFPVDPLCADAESRNDGSQDYESHLNGGSGTFESDLNIALAGTGLNAEDIARRARFAGSCIGCHEEAGGIPLGNGVSAPVQFGFVHIDEQNLQPCGIGNCFGISDALRDEFLPHRSTVLNDFLTFPPACGPAPLGGASVAPTVVRGPVATLGGQVASRHSH